MRIAVITVALAGLLTACAGDDGNAESSGAGGSATGGGEPTGSGGGDGGSGGICDGPPPAGSSLAFDGVDDHVTMGAAPQLALAELTLEAWIRRDGEGLTMGTGVGGLRLVPIAGKGRGENDGSDVDCNYAFGLFGDVLGADFEDMESGANHPVTGTSKVPWGSWHHVAATYDGSTWRLYLDGALDGTSTADATPRADSIQHFGIGAAFNSLGDPAGAFHGAIDEVRLWDHARSETEIAGDMHRTVTAGSGLVARWALDEADGGAADTLGQSPGTLDGATFVAEGAVLDHGAPPEVTVMSPDDGAALGDGDELVLAVDDADGDEVEVTFHLRQITEAEDFSIVVLPDTQRYTIESLDLADFFHDQTQWVVDNREAYDIVAVIHNGDIVNNGDNLFQWGVADDAMSRLEQALDGAPDGVPYGVTIGNHDQNSIGDTENTSFFNTYFGIDRFESRPYYGGHYGNDNDESWITFSAGGLDFVVVNLQYDTTPGPAQVEWARSIFESHPEAFGILNSHYILRSNGEFGPQGQYLYDRLSDVDNLQLMTCGHISAEARRTDEDGGNVIHSMLADYQARDEGGGGSLRIWEFSPANDELTVRTYTPTYDAFETDEDSEFTLGVDLSGVATTFDAVGTTLVIDGQASLGLTELEPGGSYEWYATVTDCAHTVTTPVRKLTANP